MMKRLLFIALGAILISCSKDNEPAITLAEEFNVSFQVKAPTSGVVTYANPQAVGVESKINKLYVYVFGPDPAVTVPDGTTEDYVLESVFSYDNIINNGETIPLTNIKVAGKNVKHFYFVANRQFTFQTGKTKETALANSGMYAVNPASTDYPYITLGGHQGLIAGMPMSYYVSIDFTNGTPSSPINIPMQRSLSRMDMINNTVNFTIESIQFFTRMNSYTFQSDFDGSGNYLGTVNGLTLPTFDLRQPDGYFRYPILYGQIPINLAPGLSLPAAGYTYEAPALDGSYIILRCTNGAGDNRLLEIPYEQSGTPISVKRNYVYRFTLNETPDNGLLVNFEVADWVNSGTNTEIDETAPFAFVLSSTYPTSGTVYPVFDANTNNITVPVDAGSYTITIDDNGVPLSLLESGDYDWLSNVALTFNPGTLKYDLTFDVAPFVGGNSNRAYTIYVKGDVPSQPSVALRITQSYK